MNFFTAMKCLYKVREDLYKQHKIKDYKTMNELIIAIENKIGKLEYKKDKRDKKQKTQKTQKAHNI